MTPEARREVLADVLDGDASSGDPAEVTVRDVDPIAAPIEEQDEARLRPRTLSEFVGQAQLTEHLQIVIEAARKRGQPVDHLLFAGPPGLGKTSLSGIVAAEMGVGLNEMKKHQVEQDLQDWEPLLGWLRAKEASGAPQSVDPLQETA